jgi:hypothetical protein
MQMEGGTFSKKKKNKKKKHGIIMVREKIVSHLDGEKLSYGSNLISQNLHLL